MGDSRAMIHIRAYDTDEQVMMCGMRQLADGHRWTDSEYQTNCPTCLSLIPKHGYRLSDLSGNAADMGTPAYENWLRLSESWGY